MVIEARALTYIHRSAKSHKILKAIYVSRAVLSKPFKNLSSRMWFRCLRTQITVPFMQKGLQFRAYVKPIVNVAMPNAPNRKTSNLLVVCGARNRRVRARCVDTKFSSTKK